MTATTSSHVPLDRRRQSGFRRTVVVLLAVGVLASCSSTSASESDDVPVSAAATTDPTVGIDVTAVTYAPTSTPDTAPASTVPDSILPVPPAPMALTGTLAEQAGAVANALADDSIDRSPALLAAFSAAHLPVLLADGTSLTTAPDPVGLPWSLVSSLTYGVSPTNRISLADTVGLFRLIDPLHPFDAQAAAEEVVVGLRAALASGEPSGPAFLASLVAEDARRANGADLSDPAVHASQLRLTTTTNLLVIASAMRGAYEGLVASGDLPNLAATADPGAGGTATAATSGLPRAVHQGNPVATADDNPGCDDGEGGWIIWVASKIAAGAKFAPGLPFEWNGIYSAIAKAGVDRGLLVDDVIGLTEGAGKFAGVVGALINIAVFQAQVSGRYGEATMDGSGPLVRTKTTSDGSARTITLRIAYDTTEDPKQVQQRNCILAALAATGSNAQQVLGAAANVEVETTGEEGFTKSLAAGDSIVLFGPATFHPVQTADDNGQITVPVQGRRQKRDKSDITTPVQKEFSIFFQASLDPAGASQIARAFADDILCLGVTASGDVVDGLAECQNAVIDVVKQFHWDLGEFTFPLTDWEYQGWRIDAAVFPYTLTGEKCDGDGDPSGLWDVAMVSNTSEFAFSGSMLADIDAATLSGTYSFEGTATGGGGSVPVVGSGTIRFVQDGPDAAHLVMSGVAYGPRNSGGGTEGEVSVPLTRTDCTGET